MKFSTCVIIIVACACGAAQRPALPSIIPQHVGHRYVCADGKLSPMCSVENHSSNVAGCCFSHGGMLTVNGSFVQTVSMLEEDR